MAYTPNTWTAGDTVTAAKLNNIESGIVNNSQFVITLTPTSEDMSGTMDKTPSEVDSAFKAGKRIIFFFPAMNAYFDATQYIPTIDNLISVHANIVANLGSGDMLIHVGTDTGTSTYGVTMFPLTPLT